MRWPIMPVPGDWGTSTHPPNGSSHPYRAFRLCLMYPTLPIRIEFLNALPPSYAQVAKGQARGAIGIYQPYRGITDPTLFPVLPKTKPWL